VFAHASTAASSASGCSPSWLNAVKILQGGGSQAGKLQCGAVRLREERGGGSRVVVEPSSI
jgi:hypothetical protein